MSDEIVGDYCYDLSITCVDGADTSTVFEWRFTPAEMFQFMTALTNYEARDWYQKVINKIGPQGKLFIERETQLVKLTEEYEAALIYSSLLKTNFDKSKAAKLLGIQRTTLLMKIKRLEIIQHPPDGLAWPYIEDAITEVEGTIAKAESKALSDYQISMNLKRAEKLVKTLQAEERKRAQDRVEKRAKKAAIG